MTNSILPSIASVHRTEDGSSAGDASVVAVGVIAAETATTFGDDGNGDGGDDGEDEDIGDGDNNDGDDADAGPGLTDVLPPPLTDEHFLIYMMPPMALRNATVFAGCSREDSFNVACVAVPTGHDGGHAHDTTLFTAHHAEGGAYIMGWVPCTRIAWLAPHPPAKQTSS